MLPCGQAIGLEHHVTHEVETSVAMQLDQIPTPSSTPMPIKLALTTRPDTYIYTYTQVFDKRIM